MSPLSNSHKLSVCVAHAHLYPTCGLSINIGISEIILNWPFMPLLIFYLTSFQVYSCFFPVLFLTVTESPQKYTQNDHITCFQIALKLFSELPLEKSMMAWVYVH